MTEKIKTVNISSLFGGLQEMMCAELTSNREGVLHAPSKGEGAEISWINLFNKYLPKRYETKKAFVIDSNGTLSEQMDIVIFDRQFSPFLFINAETYYVPAESVYAVFESKQDMNKKYIKYAGKKAQSVRNLYRTNARIKDARGDVGKPRELFPIISGILSLDSEWKPHLGKSFEETIKNLPYKQRLNLGCCLKGGAFECHFEESKLINIEIRDTKNALIFFFLTLLQTLQSMATVPAIEISAYSRFIK